MSYRDLLFGLANVRLSTAVTESAVIYREMKELKDRLDNLERLIMKDTSSARKDKAKEEQLVDTK